MINMGLWKIKRKDNRLINADKKEAYYVFSKPSIGLCKHSPIIPDFNLIDGINVYFIISDYHQSKEIN